jgi:hypothetical protein
VVTGSPRHDAIASADWNREATLLKRAAGLDGRMLLVLTNPIDAQGFCSSREKVDLVLEFLRRVQPLLEEQELTVVVKIHGGESFTEYQAGLRLLGSADRIRLMQTEPLYPLLTLADAAIVLASTVGLEALLFERPLGVLEIPGHDFVYDYVESGAAIGIRARSDVMGPMRALLNGDPARVRKAAEYVTRNLAFVGSASQRVADTLVDQLTAVRACL